MLFSTIRQMPLKLGMCRLFVLFVCFVALRPKSTAMVNAGRSVHLTTLFSWASLNKQLYLYYINLILAFIITIISQLIEHVIISSAVIVHTNTEMHVVLCIYR